MNAVCNHQEAKQIGENLWFCYDCAPETLAAERAAREALQAELDRRSAQNLAHKRSWEFEKMRADGAVAECVRLRSEVVQKGTELAAFRAGLKILAVADVPRAVRDFVRTLLDECERGGGHG